jgi:hypothetical protein
MSAPIFAPDHNGIYVSASGILTRKENNKGLRFMREEMHKHLETLAEEYYSGNAQIVDAFLQLYCLGREHRKAAKEQQEVAK